MATFQMPFRLHIENLKRRRYYVSKALSPYNTIRLPRKQEIRNEKTVRKTYSFTASSGTVHLDNLHISLSYVLMGRAGHAATRVGPLSRTSAHEADHELNRTFAVKKKIWVLRN